MYFQSFSHRPKNRKRKSARDYTRLPGFAIVIIYSKSDNKNIEEKIFVKISSFVSHAIIFCFKCCSHWLVFSIFIIFTYYEGISQKNVMLSSPAFIDLVIFLIFFISSWLHAKKLDGSLRLGNNTIESISTVS